MRFFAKILFVFVSLVSIVHSYNYQTYLEHRSFLKRVEIENHQIAYLDIGEGEPILFLHGVPTSSWLYRKIIGHLLQEKKYRLIAPDLLGFGHSDKPLVDEEYTSKKQAKRIMALMQHLKIKKWHHVCHDLGGIWTWEIIKEDPKKIENLIVLNTIGYEKGFKPPFQLKKNSWMYKIITKMLKGEKSGRRLIKNIIKGNVHKKKNVDQEAIEGYFIPIKEGGYFAYSTFLTSIKNIKANLSNYNEILEKVRPRTSIIWGKKDKFLLAKKQVPLFVKKLNIPQDRVFVLEKSKHFIQEEDAKKIATYIDNILSQN